MAKGYEPGSDGETFGRRLQRARVEAGLSQAQLSALISIPKPTLSRYENDHVRPAVATLVRLADGLGTTVAILLGTVGGLGDYLVSALRDRGVVIDSFEDADRIADSVARSARQKRPKH